MNHKQRLTVAVYQELRDPSGVLTYVHDAESTDDVFKTMWKNTSLTGGMALTDLGVQYLVEILDLAHWQFSVDINTSAVILMMERYMTTPYYLTSKKSKHHCNLVLFCENTATQLILYNNDLQAFLRAQDIASARPVTKHHTPDLK